MSVIEKKEAIAVNYHCNDIHGETCVDTCTTCERYLRDDLDELEKEIRADERAKVIEEFVKAIEKNQTRHDSYSAPIEFDMSVDMTDILKIAEQLKEQSND